MLPQLRWLLSGLTAGCLSLPAFAQYAPPVAGPYQYPQYPMYPMAMQMNGQPLLQIPAPPAMQMVQPVVMQQPAAEAMPAAPANDAQRIGKLEAEVASLKSQLTAPAKVLQADSCNTCCKTGGLVGGVEFLWLRPMNSEGVAPLFDAVIDLVNGLAIPGVAIQEPEFSYEPAWRLWLGWQLDGGLGIRARYFQFDHTASATSVFPGGVVSPLNLSYGLEAHLFDVELTDALRLGEKWDILLSAGFRYAEYREVNTADITIVGVTPLTLATGFNSQSYGLTLGGEVRRSIGQRLALFGSARGSILFGKEDEVFAIGIPALAPIVGVGGLDLTEHEDDNVKSILEFQLGTQWQYEFGNGALLFARGSVEAQIWDNFTGAPILNSSASAGFFGFGLSVGLSR